MCRKNEIYAPSYYNSFKCISDKCKHSCCIDWEICIDDETLEKYKSIGDIFTTVAESEDGACFELAEDGRCPHLNKSGLCDIIISHGEDYLSEICRLHPRFFNYVGRGRTEAGLGIVCEEACRLVLENEKPFYLSKVEDFEEDDDYHECDEEIQADFDSLPYRDKIISFVETTDFSFDDKIKSLQDEYGLSDIFSPDEWIDRLLSLEILDNEWEAYLKSSKGKPKCRVNSKYDKCFARLLTYFIYRHVSVSENYDNLRARLSFSILSVNIIRYLFESETTHSEETLIDIARRYSSEIEYSEDNTYELIFEFESGL